MIFLKKGLGEMSEKYEKKKKKKKKKLRVGIFEIESNSWKAIRDFLRKK
jgi:hypothetical protein